MHDLEEGTYVNLMHVIVFSFLRGYILVMFRSVVLAPLFYYIGCYALHMVM